MPEKIAISINGESEYVCKLQSLEQLLADRKCNSQQVAVAINCQFVARGDYASTEIQAGDKIDILSPIAGG